MSPPDTLLIASVGVLWDFGVLLGMSCAVAFIAVIAGAMLAIVSDLGGSVWRLVRGR